MGPGSENIECRQGLLRQRAAGVQPGLVSSLNSQGTPPFAEFAFQQRSPVDVDRRGRRIHLLSYTYSKLNRGRRSYWSLPEPTLPTSMLRSRGKAEERSASEERRSEEHKQREKERDREKSQSSAVITSRLGIARRVAEQQQAHADRREHNDRLGEAKRGETRDVEADLSLRSSRFNVQRNHRRPWPARLERTVDQRITAYCIGGTVMYVRVYSRLRRLTTTDD